MDVNWSLQIPGLTPHLMNKVVQASENYSFWLPELLGRQLMLQFIFWHFPHNHKGYGDVYLCVGRWIKMHIKWEREIKLTLRFRSTSLMASDECTGPWLWSRCCTWSNAFLIRPSPPPKSITWARTFRSLCPRHNCPNSRQRDTSIPSLTAREAPLPA